MPLPRGTMFGPYEILSLIGAGGMGEVYRARDSRLDRTVAIKILPARAIERPELRERFEREARAVSSLNHPHICTLYDVGSQDGTDYLVMEHLEGQTLAERLAKGPIPLDQTLRFGAQIADALDRAHRQGVIHRDLKPGNIMLVKPGAKLLDFGLAKLRPADAPGALPGSSAVMTQQADLTAEGSIAGTLQYMSPEQLEGKEADTRSDLFSLGSVLYEMVTGRRAFPGTSQASVIAAILEREPAPISTAQPMTPPALDRLVKRCLAKEPDDRWQSAGDLASELKWIAESDAQGHGAAGVVAPRRVWERVWMGASLVLGAAVVTMSALLLTRTSPGQPALRSTILPPVGVQLLPFGQVAGPVVVSPNGRHLVFTAKDPEGNVRLFVHHLDGASATSLSGTEEGSRPFWSPDSRSVGFFAKNKLKRVDIAGGPPVDLGDAPDGRGGAWSREGVIVYAPDAVGPLLKVAAAGGPLTPVTNAGEAPTNTTDRYPSFLPDGRHFLFLRRAEGPKAKDEGTSILAGSLDSMDAKLVVRGTSNALYASGYLLYARNTSLMAQPFDTRRLETSGDADPIAEHVYRDRLFSSAVFSVSDNGVLAFQTGETEGETALVWYDRDGKQIGQVGDKEEYSSPVLSPDGSRLGVISSDAESGNVDLWIYDLARNLRTRFTFEPSSEIITIWSPDGSRVAYCSTRNGHFDLYVKAASGVGSEELLLQSPFDKFVTDWSPDGSRILFAQLDPNMNSMGDLWTISPVGDRQPKLYLGTPFDESDGRFSPDGRWVAYVSDESGRKEIYVAPFPTPNGKWQVSTTGGKEPRWASHGSELFYLAPDNRLMVASVSGAGESFRVTGVSPLFQINPSQQLGGKYDIDAGGRRILVNARLSSEDASPITLVVNWTAGIRTRTAR
ncbi:MAG TPA: protein kinase [Candidatus Polarisedimenticolia bacterium]|nr:protein kinase [Candidatus Polarisedimenticolia bacterium]